MCSFRLDSSSLSSAYGCLGDLPPLTNPCRGTPLTVAMQKAADGDTVCERAFRMKGSVPTENVILIPRKRGEDALGSIRPAKGNVISLKTP